MKETLRKKGPWGRRRRAAFATVVLAAALLLTGTFAYFGNAEAVNKFFNTASGEEGEKDVVLHDDFAGGPTKHVYVENTGEVDLYVRIKLQEFMDLTSNVDPGAGNPSYVYDWTTHKPVVAVNDCGEENDENELFHDNFSWTMGGWKRYMPAAYGSGTVSDTSVYSSSTPGTKTTPNAAIISMAEYKTYNDLQKKAFIGWVIDNADGWAYWSQVLSEGQVTGLLLSKIDAAPAISDIDYFYAINVIMEAVDEKDLPMWLVPSGNGDGLGQPSVEDGTTQTEEASNDAKDLVNGIAPQKPVEATLTGIQIINPPDKTVYTVGQSFDDAGLEIQANYDDGSSRLVSGYSYSPTTAFDTEGTVTITISYGGETTTLTVQVNPESPLSGIENMQPGAEITIDDNTFIKVDEATIGEHNYALLVTKNSYGITMTYPFGNSSSSYASSNVRLHMLTEFFDSVKDMETIYAAMVFADISGEISVPTTDLVYGLETTDIMKGNPIFALSKTEASGVALTLTSANWWTRSVEGNSVWISDKDGTGGFRQVHFSNTGNSIRPAFWVMTS
ncbi:MAG: bacterial Ig-like domain-containing protein [Coriobacteriia bacterium]|nr:bacterial Ig-like domain-containing protein [Coriobacteriia bacterium]